MKNCLLAYIAHRKSHITLILAIYLALAVAYSLASPIYEPTDELRHFRYVRHIAVYHTLPVQQAEGPRAQSHHPPLYYALGALVSGWVPVAQDVYYEPPINPYWGYRYWELSTDNKLQYIHATGRGGDERFPFRGVALAVYLVRWMTILLGAGAVWLTDSIGRELFPGEHRDRPALAAGAAALIAFNPQFLHLSGAVNNDIPAALCGAAVSLACLRLVRNGPSLRADVTLGILYGLALLTKFHLLALLAVIELAYILAAARARAWRGFLRGNGVVLGLAALIAGWWFWRNYALYGDPTGMNKVNELWAGRSASGNWWAVRQSLPYLWSSLWGRFGYGQLPLPEAVYRGALCLCGLALAGGLIPRRAAPIPWAALSLLSATGAVFIAVVCYYIMIQPAGAMGRFLFPALPALATVLMWGLSRLLPRPAIAGGVVVPGMTALAVYALLGVLMPAFTPPRPLRHAALETLPNPTDVQFGDLARLLGYRVTPAVVEPGDTLYVTLYWQPLAQAGQEHAVFVHLLSEADVMIAQRDTYPGLGRYPTTAWEPGHAFADTYRLHIPETAYTPDTGYIQVGLYLPGGPRLLTSAGYDALRLAQIEVRPRPGGDLPNPLDIRFGDRIALAGYRLDRRRVRPGETVHLTLYWRGLTEMDTDYNVFAHILGIENQVWGRADGGPAAWSAPTSGWQPGQVVEDARAMMLDAATPPGIYDIEVGLYAPDGARLPVVAEDGHWLDNRVLLSKIRVEQNEW